MDDNNTKLDSVESKNNNSEQEENPNLSSNGEQQEGDGEREGRGGGPQRQTSRTPFTNLSQEDADLALARTLQEQERAYMMLRMNNDGSNYGSWEAGSYLHDDEDDFGDPDDETDDEDGYNDTDVDDDADAFDVHAHADAGDHDNTEVEIDPSVYSSDEAYARALQEAEEREVAARLLALAGLNGEAEEDTEEDHGGNSQDTWEEVDPDELSYEELLALGEVVGTESRGLSAATIASLPSINYKTGSSQNGSNDSCVICRLDYEDGETLTLLSCKHSYHSECINNWLKINKACPVCNTEVSSSANN
ncbi:zinc finger family protein [Salix suchowensis]|nr:zinc finger family protein [Salix suchowensis]